MTDSGTLRILECFDTYAQADEQVDTWQDRYASGFVDIYSRSFLLNAEVEA